LVAQHGWAPFVRQRCYNDMTVNDALSELSALGSTMAMLIHGGSAAAAALAAGARCPAYISAALLEEWRGAGDGVRALRTEVERVRDELLLWRGGVPLHAACMPAWHSLRGKELPLEGVLRALRSNACAGLSCTQQRIADAAPRSGGGDTEASACGAAAAWLQEMRAYYVSSVEYLTRAMALLALHRVGSLSDLVQLATQIAAALLEVCAAVAVGMDARLGWLTRIHTTLLAPVACAGDNDVRGPGLP
jgi:hypothetical protein